MIVERQSDVDAPTEQVWSRVVTPEGINDELRPWMTMSMPRGTESLTVDNIPIGTPIGRCWMRLFGVIPIDYDLLTITELTPGRGFDERSTMMSMRQWRHERTIMPDVNGKTLVRDRLTFELRAMLRPLTPVFAAGIGVLFAHRHRRLQRHFPTNDSRRDRRMA
jgi:ligand-binding SRPBCC domain-containing protein